MKHCAKDTLYQQVCFSISGSLQPLLEYETLRQRHIIPTLAGIDALYRLYRTSWTPMVLARSLGLQVTNSLTPLKVSYCHSLVLQCI